MPGQVNARLPPERDAEFNRWVAEEGTDRGGLARRIIEEALAARREGRASFDRPQTLSMGDMVAMKGVLDRGLMEIERIATDWAKHRAEMQKREREDQLALTKARAEFVAGIPDRITDSLNPIREEMDAMVERIDKQPRLDAIDAKQVEHTEALKANTAAIERLAKEPRTHTTLDLGFGDMTGKAWSIALGLLWLLSVGSYFVIAKILPRGALAVRSADTLLGGGDQAICALVNFRHGTDTCRTRVNGREVGVVLNVPTPKREGRR